MSTITQNPVQVMTGRMSTPNGVLKIDYPVVAGLADASVQQKINAAIWEQVNRLITEQGYYTDNITTMQGWYEIKSNERGILSLTLGNYAYHYHAAHGLTVNRSLTFDVNTGRQYKLSELFKPGSDYVGVLSGIVAAQIKEREIITLEEFKAISPEQDFYIADKSLVLYFQLYELTPYAYGFPYFPISVYDLQDIIDEDGPLGKMSANI